MKFCKYCGNSIDDNAIFCSSCGARVNDDAPGGYNQNCGFNRSPFGSFTSPYYSSEGSSAIAVLSFFFWEVGLVLWLVWRRTNPGKARSAAKGALANACLGMPVLGLVLWLIWREDIDKQDYAKVCGISAIVGAVFAAICLLMTAILAISGALG